MKDPRNLKLAKIIVNDSLNLKSGEKVLIQGNGEDSKLLVRALISATKNVGAYPLYRLDDNATHREWLKNANEGMMNLAADVDTHLFNQVDAYIGFSSPDNVMELSDISSKTIDLYQKLYYNPVHRDIRVSQKRWVVLRYPSHSFAQSAGMSTEAFEDWYYKVCTLDYKKMGKAMIPLRELMDQTDRVHIIGPGKTDLKFSIKDIPSVICSGRHNIPDGEIYTAPVLNSVEGTILYNTVSIHDGTQFSDICFKFNKGQIVEATANDTKRLNQVLDIDKGARYIGEFSLGLNPYIERTVNNTLFDEKIRGSIHFTPGNAYDEAFNGNRSSLHWDIVMLQEPLFGGGEIWFDGKLIRKDGHFVLPELHGLNPENLL